MVTYADREIERQIGLIKEGLELQGIEAEVDYYQEARLLYSLRVNKKVELVVRGKKAFAESLSAFLKGMHFAWEVKK